MKLTLLGTGSPEAHKARASSGYLIETPQSKILFDCGGGVFDRLLQTGLLPGDISHLFFSHLHSDHMMDYARLVHAAWDEGAPPLQVFGPAPIARITQQYFARDGVLSTDLIARTEHEGSVEVWKSRGGEVPRRWPAPVVTEITPGFTQQFSEGWSIQGCRVPHAQPQLECMGFRLNFNNHSFVYSGDAGLCSELETLAQNCDVLLHWCYRDIDDVSMPVVTKFSPDPVQIAQLATRCNVGRLLLTHIRKKMDNPQAHARIKENVAKHYHGRFDIAEDLMSIELDDID
ncbi:MAG: MBL fold metallo-hydrolase [Pseudomonadota bacterium]